MKIELAKRHKILKHIGFWLVCYFILSIDDYVYYPNWGRNFIVNFTNIFFLLPAVYFNVNGLIPKFLLLKKNVRYTFISIAVISATVLAANYVNYFLFNSIYYNSLRAFLAAATEFLAVYAFTTVVKFLQLYYQQQNRVKELHNQNLQSELTLLKSQVNPHFLFNTLNNIYFLIEKNPDDAQQVILKLSDLLSHQLYTTKNGLVSLTDELTNLSNYIELQRIRKEELAEVHFSFPEYLNEFKIAPMLLLPIIENAFKHGQSATQKKSFVDIQIQVEGSRLKFTCLNSFEPKLYTPLKGGIGLTNVKRRLQLLYCDKHSFITEMKNSLYSVTLSILLDEN